ncbi:MAG: tetratricopeptide repeat protein [Candidatus Thermoplasmatota archaeon]|nr:tetratricopeptide repeat protein [Candidatus Thermoplasmatota archaeon]
MDEDIDSGFFMFQSPWRNIFLWNLMEVEKEALIVTPFLDIQLMRKVQSIMIARNNKKLRLRFITRFSQRDLLENGIDPDVLKILTLMKRDPASRIELRFAGNLSTTMAIFDSKKAIMATGDLSEKSMVDSINHGVLITGMDMVTGILEDMDSLWEASYEKDEKGIMDYVNSIKALRSSIACDDRLKDIEDKGDDKTRAMDLSGDVKPLGKDRKEPHLDEHKKIVKGLLIRAKDSADEGDHDTALFYLEEALTMQPERTELLIEKCRILFDFRSDHQTALECADKVLEIDVDNRDAWAYRGMCYEMMGDLEEALYSYDQATDIDPNHHPVWIRKGGILGRTRGREEDGLKCLEFALEKDPYSEEAWYLKAQILEQRLNRMDEAVMAYRTLLRINPKHIKGSFRLGLLSYKKLNDNKKARKYFDAVVASDPSHIHAWMFKGEMAERFEGDIDEAIACYEKAREIKNDSIEILRREIELLMKNDIHFEKAYRLSGALLQASPKDPIGLYVQGIGSFKLDNEPNRALTILNDAIHNDPGYIPSIIARSQVLSKGLNRADEAISSLNSALKSSPGNASLMIELGKIYFEYLYDPIEAIRIFEELTSKHPNDPDGWYWKGIVLTRGLDKHQDALSALDSTTMIKDDHSLAWYEKGRILDSVYSMSADALKCFRKSISIDDRNPEALVALATTLSKKDVKDESYELLEKTIKVDPHYMDAYISLYELFLREGDRDGGSDVLNQALREDPKNDRIWTKKASLFIEMNETTKAFECIKRALTINPGNTEAQELRSKLETN